MSIRLDPRRLAALKLLAGEEGLRPGELVTRWVEERLDAARSGAPAPAPSPAAANAAMQAVEALGKRVDELARRLDTLAAAPAAAPAPAPLAAAPEPGPDAAPAASAPKRRGRPPKAAATKVAPAATGTRVPLHEEIMAIIGERGPQTAGELATAILDRGRYAPPRSAKPLDAAAVNARVSNPVYRARFTRDRGRIGLANAG
ncbi:MAG TPA: hypothetical protein VH987_02515 [Candidatus Limnocylindria bacterium]|jgi:hypothetical protein